MVAAIAAVYLVDRESGKSGTLTKHYDDMLATVQRLALDRAAGIQPIVYRQLVDLFAQGKLPLGHPARPEALALMEFAQARSPALVRQEMARLAARYCADDIEVIAIMADDCAEIAAPLLEAAILPLEGWRLLAPRLSPQMRATLVAREDLDQEFRRNLVTIDDGPRQLGEAGRIYPISQVDAGDSQAERLFDAASPEPPRILETAPTAAEDLTARPVRTLPNPDLTRVGNGGTQTTESARWKDARREEARTEDARTGEGVAAGANPSDNGSTRQVQDLIRRIMDYQERRRGAEFADAETGRILPWPLHIATSDENAEAETSPLNQDATGAAPGPATRLTAFQDVVFSSVDWCWETNRRGEFVALHPVSHNPDPLVLGALVGADFIHWLPAGVERDRILTAMTRHAPFRGVMVDIDLGPATGAWSLAAVPVFEQVSGHFTGYRGTATALDQLQQSVRQPHDAGESQKKMYGDNALNDASRESLYVMAHELRSPLNAILGFAQLIESEALGSVPPAYRAQASGILSAGDRLMCTVDEFLDTARADRGRGEIVNLQPAELVSRLVENLQGHAMRRDVFLIGRIGTGLPTMWADCTVLERLLTRLVVLTVALAAPGETIVTAVHAGRGDSVRFSVSRPDAPPTHAKEPSQASLGGDFSLRLIGQMAEQLNGQFTTVGASYIVTLPALAHPSMMADASTPHHARRQ